MKGKQPPQAGARKRSALRFPVVGIGASAGGIEALEALFRGLPSDCPMALVVAMHLAPGTASHLPEILSRCTSIPVVPITDGMMVRCGHAYVAPPDTLLTIRRRRLSLAKPTGPHWKVRPIDAFLSSLAEDREALAIGVLLSGAGSDGSAGFGAIQRHGGVTIVQGHDPSGPRFAEMPRTAQEIGVVDLAVPITKLPATLTRLARDLEQPPVPMPPAGIDAIYHMLNERTGHDFSHYKQASFLRRVQRRLQLHRIQSLPRYIKRLRRDPAEAIALFRDVLIGVTEFFRDADAFEALKEKIIPRVFEGKRRNGEVRIWVPACATGEEAFSIAMLLREHMDGLKSPPRIQIFATDIEENALAIARAAKYAKKELGDLEPERVKRFFVSENGHYRVAGEIRDMCVFSAQSAIKDPPFSRLDLISCRNLMIYLSPELQGELVQIFHYALRPGGFLFLGTSENLSRHEGLFTAIDKKHRIFQRHDISMPPPIAWLKSPFHRRPDGSGATAARTAPRTVRERLMRTATDAVRDRFAPPYVVVDAEGGIIEFSSRTGAYLEAPAGPPNRNLFAMARNALKQELRSLFRKVKETQAPCSTERLTLSLGKETRTVRLSAEPLHDDQSVFYLIVFVEMEATDKPPKSASHRTRTAGATERQIQQLEFELKETREQLQSMIEELETANEELRSSNEELLSMNEELQSTNEEMQTSKEELQSVNKQLETVNRELNEKVTLLDQANSDLKNIFDGTQIATIFVDRHLIIRTFTPAVAGIFNLIPADQGRPLTDIAHQLQYDGLKEDATAVIRRGKTIERRVATLDGTSHYLLRMLPYRTTTKQMNGAVLTLIDITNLVEAEEHQRLLTHELSHRVKNTLAVVLAIANQTLKRSSTPRQFNDAFQQRLHALAVTNDFLSESKWSKTSLAGVIRAVLTPHTAKADHRIRLKGPEISLTPRAAVTLGMAIDELATNAMKYGALSNADGTVSVDWKLTGRQAAPALEILWRERGGPAVGKPKSGAGLGTELLTRSIAYEMQGKAALKFAKAGLECRISIPANDKLFRATPSDSGATDGSTRGKTRNNIKAPSSGQQRRASPRPKNRRT